MKKLFFAALLLLAATSCEEGVTPNKIWDRPEVDFFDEEFIVPAEGGEFTIAVSSTGINDVIVEINHSLVQDESGDLYPTSEWIEFVKVINQYDDSTRALAQWQSGIVIKVEPNDGVERSATVTASSFTKSDFIVVKQRGA